MPLGSGQGHGHAVQGGGGHEEGEKIERGGDDRLGNPALGQERPYPRRDRDGVGSGGNPEQRDPADPAVAASCSAWASPGRTWSRAAFDPPLGHTRDHVAIVRRVLAAEGPVTYQGQYLSLPSPRPSATPLATTVRPPRTDLPILLGAEGPKNVVLAREMDRTYYSPYRDSHCRRRARRHAEGARPTARHADSDFE